MAPIIAGAVIGVLAYIGLMGTVFWFIRRRWRRHVHRRRAEREANREAKAARQDQLSIDPYPLAANASGEVFAQGPDGLTLSYARLIPPSAVEGNGDVQPRDTPTPTSANAGSPKADAKVDAAHTRSPSDAPVRSAYFKARPLPTPGAPGGSQHSRPTTPQKVPSAGPAKISQMQPEVDLITHMGQLHNAHARIRPPEQESELTTAALSRQVARLEAQLTMLAAQQRQSQQAPPGYDSSI